MQPSIFTLVSCHHFQSFPWQMIFWRADRPGKQADRWLLLLLHCCWLENRYLEQSCCFRTVELVSNPLRRWKHLTFGKRLQSEITDRKFKYLYMQDRSHQWSIRPDPQARPAVIFAWFRHFGMDGRTIYVKIVINTGPDCGPTSWITI